MRCASGSMRSMRRSSPCSPSAPCACAMRPASSATPSRWPRPSARRRCSRACVRSPPTAPPSSLGLPDVVEAAYRVLVAGFIAGEERFFSETEPIIRHDLIDLPRPPRRRRSRRLRAAARRQRRPRRRRRPGLAEPADPDRRSLWRGLVARRVRAHRRREDRSEARPAGAGRKPCRRGGNTGTGAVAKSPGDGYTFVISTNGPLVYNTVLYKRLGYDPFTELRPVVLGGCPGQRLRACAATPASPASPSWSRR